MNKPPVFLALDVETESQALNFVEKTHPFVLGYKLGPRLYLKYGMPLVKKITAFSEVFLDFKFYDIPSSTIEAVRTAYEVGARYVTVHASVGEETLKELSRLEKSFEDSKFHILSVTVLSSVSGSHSVIQNQVNQLAQMVLNSGLKGLVCSPLEVEFLRKKYPDAFLVTPGIRLEGDKANDQKRWMSPAEAIQKGSSALVIGRSILNAENPVQVCKDLAQTIGSL